MKEATKNKAISVIDRTALFFFIVLVFLLPISKAAIEINFCLIFFCFLVKLFFISPSWAKTKNFFSNRINLSLLVFYICIGLSMFSNPDLFPKSFKAWFFKWGEGVFLFYFAQVFLKRGHIKILATTLIASSFLLGIDGMYQKFMGVDFLRGFPATQADSGFLGIRASFNHYNGFASFLVVAFFINIGYIMYLKKTWIRLVVTIIPFLVIINLLFAYSRGAWISFLFVSLMLIGIVPNKKEKITLSLFLFFFTIILISIPALKERFLFIFQSGGDTDRFKVWQIAIDMFKDSPILGKGIGLFMSFFRDYSEHLLIQYAHNCYLQILAETGLLGLLSFLWFLIEVIRGAYKKIKEKQDFLLIGIFAAFIAFSVHMFFDTQLYSLQLAMLFWLLVSFLGIYIVEDSLKKA